MDKVMEKVVRTLEDIRYDVDNPLPIPPKKWYKKQGVERADRAREELKVLAKR